MRSLAMQISSTNYYLAAGNLALEADRTEQYKVASLAISHNF
jgi:hypothetical protein